MSLRLRSVTGGYGATTVLRSVDLDLATGAVVALLGPNGAGKTTLLRTIAGLLRPATGTIALDGQDLVGRSPEAIAGDGLCLIPEGRGIFPTLTVRENLVLQSPPGVEAASIERAIDAFPWIRDRLTQVAGTLSGGQQQMVALCRAYVGEARVVLVDEVSMGLAPVLLDQIYEFLHRLRAEGAALLIVEQFIDRALDLADEVYVLQKGECTALGSPRGIDHDTLISGYLGVTP